MAKHDDQPFAKNAWNFYTEGYSKNRKLISPVFKSRMPNKLLPPTGPGRPKDPAKRKAILEAAKTLFLRNGYAGSSMDAIAAEAGVSKLTVYSHFTDKETLFSFAVTAKCQEQLPELVFDLPANASLESALFNVGRGFVNLINSHESIELHRVMVARANTDPMLGQLFFNSGPQRLINGMHGLLGKAVAQGKLQINDPQRAAEHFLALLKGVDHFQLLLGCCAVPSTEENTRHINEVVQFFIRAYRCN
jgi:TetR/AcrR family transcriptional repressor of mexJK operon